MNLAVVGSLNMDLVVTAARLPQKGETITGQSLASFPGGKGANQAFALARLGANVRLYGCVGQDSHGRQLLANLQAAGVDTRGVAVQAAAPTGLALITVAESDNTIIVVPGANHLVDEQYIETIKTELLKADLVLLQLEIPLATVYRVCRLCFAAAVPVLLNPAPARPLEDDIIAGLTLLTPNQHEAALIFAGSRDQEELLRQHREKLVITLGEQGSIMAGKDGRIIRAPAIKARPVDTTGAGDTFNAALAFAVTAGYPPEKALGFANTAAGISIEKMGAQAGMPTLAEVMARQGRPGE